MFYLGTFMLSAFTSIKGSEAEEFLFNNCLMEEILMLEKGYAVRLGDVTYLLQGRLIQCLFDLPQLDASLNVQVQKSKSGLGLMYGSYGISRCKRVVYNDLRVLTPWKHILRTLGQALNCCPPNYFTNDINDIKNDETYYQEEVDAGIPIKERSIQYNCTGRAFFPESDHIYIDAKNAFNKKLIGANGNPLKLNNYEKRIEILKSDLEFLQNLKDTCTSREEYTMKIEQLKTIRGPCDLEKQVFDDIFLKTRSVTDMDLRLVALYFTPCDDSNRGAIIEYLFLNPSNDDPPIWYHEKIPMRIFTSEGTTWFEFPNFQKQIKLKRKTSNLYRKCAKKMDELNIKCYKGVKGNFFGHLSKLIKIEMHVNVDPTHTISNIMKYYLKYWKGKRIEYNSTSFIDLCRQTKCHPCIYRKDVFKTIPWIIKSKSQGLIDAIVNSILVPMGMREEFEVRSIFVYITMKKFNVLLDIICVLMPIIMIFSDLPLQYKAYFMMFSQAICKFTSPIVDKSEINDLHNKIVEIAILHNGLFPQTEHYVQMPSLVLLAKHIRNAGIWKGWATIAGERFHQLVKNKIGRGGANYAKTLATRYYKQENLKSRTFYDFSIEEKEEEDYENNIDKEFTINSNSDNITFNNIIKNNRELIIRNHNNNKTLFYNPFRMLVYDANITLRTKVATANNGLMDDFEAEDLLNCLIKEIMKATKTVDEAKSKSDLFKLYVTYHDWKEQHGSKWFRKSLNNPIDGQVQISFLNFIWVINEICECLIKNRYPDNDYTNTYNQECFQSIEELIADEDFIGLDTISKLLDSLSNCFCYQTCDNKCTVGETALIYGRRFLCRGFDTRKIGEQDSTKDYINAMIDLRKNWKKKYYFRSYCKFRYSPKLNNHTHNHEASYNIHHPDKTRIGILNYFMRLELPTEPLLDGIKFASITSFITEKKEVWNSDQINETYKPNGNYPAPFMDIIDFTAINKPHYIKFRDTYKFIAFTDILPSQYGSFGLDHSNKPFPQIREQNFSKAVKDYFEPYNSQLNFEKAEKLYIFPLKPERLNIVYDKANIAMYNE